MEGRVASWWYEQLSLLRFCLGLCVFVQMGRSDFSMTRTDLRNKINSIVHLEVYHD